MKLYVSYIEPRTHEEKMPTFAATLVCVAVLVKRSAKLSEWTSWQSSACRILELWGAIGWWILCLHPSSLFWGDMSFTKLNLATGGHHSMEYRVTKHTKSLSRWVAAYSSKHNLPMSYPILPFWCHSFVPGKLHLCPTKPPIGKDESALASHLQKTSLVPYRQVSKEQRDHMIGWMLHLITNIQVVYYVWLFRALESVENHRIHILSITIYCGPHPRLPHYAPFVIPSCKNRCSTHASGFQHVGF